MYCRNERRVISIAEIPVQQIVLATLYVHLFGGGKNALLWRKKHKLTVPWKFTIYYILYFFGDKQHRPISMTVYIRLTVFNNNQFVKNVLQVNCFHPVFIYISRKKADVTRTARNILLWNYFFYDDIVHVINISSRCKISNLFQSEGRVVLLSRGIGDLFVLIAHKVYPITVFQKRFLCTKLDIYVFTTINSRGYL